MLAVFGYVNCLKIRAFRVDFGFLPSFLATRWYCRGKNNKKMLAVFGYVNCLKIRAFRGPFGFLSLFLATRWHRRGKNNKKND